MLRTRLVILAVLAITLALPGLPGRRGCSARAAVPRLRVRPLTEDSMSMGFVSPITFDFENPCMSPFENSANLR